ncbi:hypothetical protein CN204_12615 [Sinorhizobium meliloti]|nr:hypothetical protein CN204_12615 [Sinorhizobium meliloti]RVN97672.1 hypothetical protein CN102_36190 [Sinorhizobium meliloti]
MFNKEGAAYQRSVLICCLFSAGSRGRCSIFVATRRRCHDLLEAYAKFRPDTVGIAEALDIKEHEVDPLINMKMNRDRLGPTVCQMATLNTPPRAVRDCKQLATCAPRVAPSCLFTESPPAHRRVTR